MNDFHALLPQMTQIAQAAGDRLLDLYDPGSRPRDEGELFAAMQRNENVVSTLPDELRSLYPRAGYLADDFGDKTLPDGEWWVVDAVEGNVNHVHGIGEWCVTITLVADNSPVLAVVRQPVGDHTYTASLGHGAYLGTVPMHVSAKSDLAVAVALTGQAEHGQTDTHERIARSVGEMLGHSLLVRASVPSTFPMLAVASGHADIFWQYRPVLHGVAAGLLLISEACGRVSRIDGTPWTTGSSDILATNQPLSPRATTILAPLS